MEAKGAKACIELNASQTVRGMRAARRCHQVCDVTRPRVQVADAVMGMRSTRSGAVVVHVDGGFGIVTERDFLTKARLARTEVQRACIYTMIARIRA